MIQRSRPLAIDLGAGFLMDFQTSGCCCVGEERRRKRERKSICPLQQEECLCYLSSLFSVCPPSLSLPRLCLSVCLSTSPLPSPFSFPPIFFSSSLSLFPTDTTLHCTFLACCFKTNTAMKSWTSLNSSVYRAHPRKQQQIL